MNNEKQPNVGTVGHVDHGSVQVDVPTASASSVVVSVSEPLPEVIDMTFAGTTVTASQMDEIRKGTNRDLSIGIGVSFIASPEDKLMRFHSHPDLILQGTATGRFSKNDAKEFDPKTYIDNAVSVLNNALSMDREGLSRLFTQFAHVDARLQNTPLELQYLGVESHALLSIIGLVNGAVHAAIADSTYRINVEMRNTYVIERFVVQETKQLDEYLC
jgi:hypothetical protein